MKKSFYCFLLVIIIFGASLLRLQLVQSSYYPLNDGGLFYQMVEDLQENNFRLPEYTTYNQNNIPFVYPPLPLFFVGVLNSISGIDLVQLFKYLPLIFNIIAIPVVSLLIFEITQNDQIALMATFLWSMAVPSYQWQIMGGGITRSPALLLSFACLLFLSKHFKNPSWRNRILTSIFAALTLLSHFEIFWSIALSMVVFWLFSSNHKKNLLELISITGLTILLSLPYWVTIIQNHGIQPLVSSLGSGEFNIIKSIVVFTMFNYANEFSFTIISALGFIGLFYLLYWRKSFIPVWFLVMAFLDPRSAARSVLLPLSILASIVVIQIILPSFHQITFPKGSYFFRFSTIILNPKAITLFPFIFIIIISTFYASLVEGLNMQGISREEKEDMVWIKTNTPSDAKFLVLSSAKIWQYDHTAEWFPVLTGRTSINTVQGNEWLPNGSYEQASNNYNQVKGCYYQDEACAQNWLRDFGLDVGYIFVEKSPCSDARPFCNINIITALKMNQAYQILYESESGVVFSADL
jgi:hypothetical protein